MKKCKMVNIIGILIFSFLILTPGVVYGDEVNNELEEQTSENTKVGSDEKQDETNNKENDIKNNEKKALQKESSDDNNITEKDSLVEEHKVAVITTKVDENGNPLKGAVLQILDEDGNVLDEWTSDGEEHTSLLPEGTYVLHEKNAPEGYKIAEDKAFTVEAKIIDIDAGVDFSKTPCSHYGGTPLYYVESEGEKYEVYCINQDWETPDENSIYDGQILKQNDIRKYTKQTVYVDAHQNKQLMDISDQSLNSQELYDKILNIIYHRQEASSIFSDLTEAEIRYVTESALKNYTNAGLTRVQGVKLASQLPDNYDSYDYYYDGTYRWYLYPWYRSFVYDPTQPLGKDIFRTDIGNGDAFGTLARHWSSAHNAKNSEEVRKIIARYYELYLYLINDENTHPEDMHLYIYETDNKAIDLSSYDFDNGAYQNLLGIRWFNPYDEKHVVNLTYKNEKDIIFHEKEVKKESLKKKIEKRIIKNKYKNPKTGDSIMLYIILLPISLSGLVGSTTRLRKNTISF